MATINAIGTPKITLADTFTMSGAHPFTGTLTGTTTVTFPTSGTLATTSQLPTPAALTRTDDTNVTITLGGTPGTALLQATSLTMGWTGTLAVGRGGLGISTTPTNGQIPIGNGTNYTAATITAGTGISISNGAGSITINASAGGLSWSTIAGTTQAAAVNSGYIVGNAAQTTITLPATAAIGSTVVVLGKGVGGWIVQANTGQTISAGSQTTTTAGSLTSDLGSDVLYLYCDTADTSWTMLTTNSAGLTVA